MLTINTMILKIIDKYVQAMMTRYFFAKIIILMITPNFYYMKIISGGIPPLTVDSKFL